MWNYLTLHAMIEHGGSEGGQRGSSIDVGHMYDLW